MIFSPDLAAKVLAGEKTVTRRPVKRDQNDRLLPCRYRPRQSYAVQDRRGGRELGRIKVQSAYRETLRFASITEGEARFEGFASPGDFAARWVELYGSSYPVEVWRIVFRLEP